MKKIYFVLFILLLFLLVGCNQASPASTESQIPTYSAKSPDSSHESILFSSLFPNDWTHICVVYEKDQKQFLGEFYFTSQKSEINEFYQLFSCMELTKTDETYENRWAEFEVSISDRSFPILIIDSSKISVDNTVFSVNDDLTEKLPLLLKALGYRV